MRNVGEISNPNCRINIFAWNQKYLLKFEVDGLEQTYKVNEFDVMNDEAVKKIINEDFINSVMKIFDEMRATINKSLQK